MNIFSGKFVVENDGENLSVENIWWRLLVGKTKKVKIG